MFTVGLTESLRHAELGPAFLASALEPTLAAVETRLQVHIDAGEMRAVGSRGPAIALASPVLILFLHQHELGGNVMRPLDLDAFCHEYAASFVRAWGVSSIN